MKHSLRLLAALLAIASQSGSRVWAQTLDPSFAAVDVRQLADINDELQQPDGKVVATGTFTQVNNKPASGLARLNADGSLDEAFTTAVACQTSVQHVRQFAGGQLLLTSDYTGFIGVGGRSFRSIAKLNANGTLAAGFTTGTGVSDRGSIASVVIQPDNKILLGGQFTSFNGVAANGLVRLNADGTVDQAFVTALGTGFTAAAATATAAGTAPTTISLALRPDGKIVVVGYFRNFNGTNRSGLVQLNADGTLDTTFNPPVATAAGTAQYPFIYAVALDPRTNNAVLYGSRTTLGQSLVRLTATGEIDPAFGSFYLSCDFMYDGNERLAVDAMGRVLFAGCFTSTNHLLTRLLPNGTQDPQFTVRSQLDYKVNCLRPLADGTLLLGGSFRHYGATRNVNLIRLDANAQLVPGFAPLLTQPGNITTLALQADNKVLVGGHFCQLNGLLAGGVARLNSDGTPDPAFSLAGTDGAVYKMLVQADGRIVVGGDFQRVGPHTSPFVARLLADGTSDNTFTATSYATGYSDISYGGIKAISQQPDGSLLVGGQNITFDAYTGTLHHLSATGSTDAAYARRVGDATYYGANDIADIISLPDGRHYVAGSFSTFNNQTTSNVIRLNADGSRDNTFTATTPNTPQMILRALLFPTGQLLVGGYTYGSSSPYSATRLTATGSPDATYAPPLGGAIYDLARYPNGRLLLAGSSLTTGAAAPGSLLRLNPDGSYDSSFSNAFPNTNTARAATFTAVALQANDAILVAGNFSQISGQPRAYLARLTASNVLAVSSQQTLATTTAWPNPAHGQLQLALDAAAQPRSIALQDMAGHEVLSQPATQPTLTLNVQHLPAGTYLLRVDYAAGPVTRRITIE